MSRDIQVVFFDMGDTLTTILPSWARLYVDVCAAQGSMWSMTALSRRSAEVSGHWTPTRRG